MALIDSVAYCKELILERDYPGRSKDFIDAIEVAIADLGDMPSIDAVEVVRCEKCRLCDKTYVKGAFIGYCKNRKDSWGGKLRVGLSDYCSDGEKE